MPSNRKFGLFFSFIFCCISAYYFYVNNHTYSFSALIISSSFFLVTFLKPNLLYFLNKMWWKLGILLSKISAPIFLSSIYFLLISPTAIFTRMIGRDELKLKRHIKLTYWIDVVHLNKSNTDFKLQS